MQGGRTSKDLIVDACSRQSEELRTIAVTEATKLIGTYSTVQYALYVGMYSFILAGLALLEQHHRFGGGSPGKEHTSV
ncbi:hypothetical protein K1T71_012244 [Dendrolimus kikuchii]|uniref:Uncharacterized protein n=1 Tax=Dendrolimus kikuchii TaxID=765133 RepID=A0ACC1CL41_9NEOP|nr:hypothetical protein K1T71_012244 [Dendrolimus kikuchii]